MEDCRINNMVIVQESTNNLLDIFIFLPGSRGVLMGAVVLVLPCYTFIVLYVGDSLWP